jgi:hypothetical protein
LQRFIASWVAGSVSLSLWGCAPPPEPKALDPRQTDPFDLIAYRTLTRDDFRGPVADRSLTAASHATTPKCTSISLTPREVVTRVESAPGGTSYVATLENPVFFATFARGCSWPSPDASHPDAYVLEHEQIHFAIGELEARRMNARVETIVQRIRSAGSDREAINRRAALELRAVLAEAEEACLAKDILFDDQVRGGDRVRQRQWFHKITADLDATEMFARGPQTMLPVAVASAPPPAPGAPVTVPATHPPKSLSPTSASLPAAAPAPAAAAPAPQPVPAPAAAAPAPQPVPAPARPPAPVAAPAPAAPPTSASPSTGAFPD